MILTEAEKKEAESIIKQYSEWIADCGCWIWTGGTSNGYGEVWFRGKNIMAHRLAYLAWNGPLTHFNLNRSGFAHVCHVCDTRPCVNPAHLFLGSIGQNMCDKTFKGRQAKGERNGGHKLQSEQVVAIRSLGKLDLSQAEIASRYNISQVQVGNILRGKNWKP